MATIRDIAKRAGYSISTVSRYLNQSGYVSKIAAEEIQQVITEMDYVPNDIARDLSKGHTSTIGVVVPHLRHPYFMQLMTSIMEAAFAVNDHVVMLQSKYDAQLEVQYLEQLHRKAYDGLIFTSHGIPLTQLAAYQKYGPVICCEDPRGVKIAAAYTLRQEIYLDAFRLLQQKGYRRIAMTLSRPEPVSLTSQATMASYRQVFGTAPAPELIQTGVANYADGYQAAAAFVQLAQQPDFIFANSDDIAAAIMQRYQDANRPVPPMMGQENQLSGQLLKLPTIDHHFKEVGQLAFQLAYNGQLKQLPVQSEIIWR